MLLQYLGMIGFLIVFIGTAHATRINQEDGIMPNHSADYVRTLSRFASTDVDAAFYNPAGLAFMEKEGLHVQLSGQTYFVNRTHTMDYYGILVNSGGTVTGGLTQNIKNPNFMGKPKKYEATTTAPFLPGFDIVYKKDKWAVYLDAGLMQAAPGMMFNQGLAVLDWGIMAPFETALSASPMNYFGITRNATAKRTEYYIGVTVGGAYAILDWLSAAIGIRYIYATGNQNIEVTGGANLIDVGGGGISGAQFEPWVIDTDVKGHGAGIILGLDFKPADIVNIGIKYEFYPTMALNKKTNKFYAPATAINSGNLNMFLDSFDKLLPAIVFMPYSPVQVDISKMNPDTFKNVGKTLKVTYPQTISVGFKINILKNLRAETSGELSLRQFRDLDGREKNWRFGYRVGQCLEWNIVPTVAVSAGYSYNDTGIKPNKRDEVDPLLNSHTVGGGFKFSLTEYLDINLGGMNIFFVPAKTMPVDYTNVTNPTLHFLRKKYDEKRWSIAFGLTLHLFGKPAPEKTAVNSGDWKTKRI